MINNSEKEEWATKEFEKVLHGRLPKTKLEKIRLEDTVIYAIINFKNLKKIKVNQA